MHFGMISWFIRMSSIGSVAGDQRSENVYFFKDLLFHWLCCCRCSYHIYHIQCDSFVFSRLHVVFLLLLLDSMTDAFIAFNQADILCFFGKIGFAECLFLKCQLTLTFVFFCCLSAAGRQMFNCLFLFSHFRVVFHQQTKPQRSYQIFIVFVEAVPVAVTVACYCLRKGSSVQVFAAECLTFFSDKKGKNVKCSCSLQS